MRYMSIHVWDKVSIDAMLVDIVYISGGKLSFRVDERIPILGVLREL